MQPIYDGLMMRRLRIANVGIIAADFAASIFYQLPSLMLSGGTARRAPA